MESIWHLNEAIQHRRSGQYAVNARPDPALDRVRVVLRKRER